ncbi:trans-acting enoyl reductase family protein [Halobaculum sp. MBLA0147]|uniref:saccharopine dehydrogenase family protein n=1 Tax=Halobaculum sp. MBLA0147 TaxID=3079934 RepID=UPI003525D613
MSQTDGNYDVLVWGATGTAGSLVAAHLTDYHSPEELSLALGGRSEERLAAVAADCEANTEWDDIPLVIGDATEPDRLREIAATTDVVCTTVGPYTTYGTPLVAACVETGTDYCDLTGEVTWVREIVDEYHDAAVAADARIVTGCGFDSVPADLGTALAQEYALETDDAPCDTVRIYLEDVIGGVSGGTLASGAELFAAASNDREARRTLANPYSIAPPGEREGPDEGEQAAPRRDPLRPGWTGPSPMAPINERVVRRSNALLDYPWGRAFDCTEVIPTGTGVGGAAAAGAVAAGAGLATVAMSVDPVRELLRDHVFPDPGEGPSEETIENGRFTVRVLGRGTGEDGPFTVAAEIGADRDPGYGATAKMLGESAVALCRDAADAPLSGGVLTPATGIGTGLADRLRDVGMTVSVGDYEADAE